MTRNLGDGRLGSKSSGIWEIGVQKIRDLGDWGKIWDMGDWVCKNIYTENILLKLQLSELIQYFFQDCCSFIFELSVYRYIQRQKMSMYFFW